MYKKTALLALCTVFTLSSCTVSSDLSPIDAAVAFLKLFLKFQPKCRITLSNKKKETVPKWICALPEVKTDTGAYGLGIASASSNPSLQLDRAQAHGRAQIVSAIQTQVVNDVIDVAGSGSISSTLGGISREEVEDIAVSIRRVTVSSMGTVRGSRMLYRFKDKDGILYVLMALTDANKISDLAVDMIQRAPNVANNSQFCPTVEQCLNFSRELGKVIEGSAPIDSDSK